MCTLDICLLIAYACVQYFNSVAHSSNAVYSIHYKYLLYTKTLHYGDTSLNRVTLLYCQIVTHTKLICFVTTSAFLNEASPKSGPAYIVSLYAYCSIRMT